MATRKKRKPGKADKKGLPVPEVIPLFPECHPLFVQEAKGFVQAVLAAPDDDLPRLVFADWLEEKNADWSNPRALLIRLGCQLAQSTSFPTIEHHPAAGGKKDAPDHPWMDDPALKLLAEQEAEALKHVCRLGGYISPPRRSFGRSGDDGWRNGWEVHSPLGTAFAPRRLSDFTPAVLNHRGFPGCLWLPQGDWLGVSDRPFPLPVRGWEVPEFEPAAVRFRDDAGSHFDLRHHGVEEAGWSEWWGFTRYHGFVGEVGGEWLPFQLPPLILEALALNMPGVSRQAPDRAWEFSVVGGAVLRPPVDAGTTANVTTGEITRRVKPDDTPTAVLYRTRQEARTALSKVMGAICRRAAEGDAGYLEALKLYDSRAGLFRTDNPMFNPSRLAECSVSVTRLWGEVARGGAYFPPEPADAERVADHLNPMGLQAAYDLDPIITFHQGPPRDWADDYRDADGDDAYQEDGGPVPPRDESYVESSADMKEVRQEDPDGP